MNTCENIFYFSLKYQYIYKDLWGVLCHGDPLYISVK